MNASTDDTTDEAKRTILDRLVDVLWILPWRSEPLSESAHQHCEPLSGPARQHHESLCRVAPPAYLDRVGPLGPTAVRRDQSERSAAAV